MSSPEKKKTEDPKATEKKNLKEKIRGTSTKEDLEKIDLAEVAAHSLEDVYNARLKIIERKAKEAKTKLEAGAKRATKAGGDPKKVAVLTTAAEVKVAAVEEGAKEALAETLEGGEKDAATLESEARLANKEYIDPPIHESRKATAEKLGLASAEGTAEVAAPAEVEIPKTDIEVALDDARLDYFAAHQEFMTKREERGFFGKIKNKIQDNLQWGAIKFEDAEDKATQDKIKAKQEVYNKALLARGNEMFETKKAELIAEGKTPAEMELALAQYKAGTIFNTLVIAEKTKLIVEKKEQLPTPLRAKLGKVMTWYKGLNKAEKFALSMAIGIPVSVLIAATSGAWITGSAAGAALAAGKVLTLKTLAMKAGAIAAGQAFGATAGGIAVMAKDKIYNFDKRMEEANVEYAAKQAELSSQPMTPENFKAIQDLHNERLRKIASLDAWKHRSDFIVRIGAGVGLGMLASHGVGSMFEKWFPDATVVPPAPGPDTPPAPTHHYQFKPIEVDYSSKGAIDTWAHVKSALSKAYEGVPKDQVPPEYQEIMNSRADDLAIKFGDYRPDDINESINMLKGSSIRFDGTGKIISHSLRNAAGKATDDVLMTQGADGSHSGVLNHNNDERFFDYQAKHDVAPAPDPVVDHDPALDPDNGLPKVNLDTPPTVDGKDYWDWQNNHPHDPSPDSIPGKANPPYDIHGKWHTKLWWKHHPNGIDLRHEERLMNRLAAQEARFQNSGYGYPQGPAQYVPDFWQQQPPHLYGNGTAQPIMSAANPGQITAGYQINQPYSLNDYPNGHYTGPVQPPAGNIYDSHINPYPTISSDRVLSLLSKPVRYIDDQFMLDVIHHHDAATPLYKAIADMQAHHIVFEKGWTIEKYLENVRTHHPDYMLHMNKEQHAWLVRNHFLKPL